MHEKNTWQTALSDLITDPSELLNLLELDPSFLPAVELASKLFPLKVTRSFVARMEKSNPEDPLLRQALPLGYELEAAEGYTNDPLDEASTNPLPGLLHKYSGRVLITLTGSCAINCRYCFRRAFPYSENNPGKKGWEAIVDYIEKDTSIHEIILSGGDPLILSDRLLNQFSDHLRPLTHLKRLRIHTRLPVVLPERICAAFLSWVTSLDFLQPLVMVLHINHPNEIDAEVREAIQKLRQAGVVVLNQSVLLRGINDQANTLITLSETLYACGVIPYYLHVLDKVAGAAHFDVSREQALALHATLISSLPGYLVPRLALEQPGKLSKTWL